MYDSRSSGIIYQKIVWGEADDYKSNNCINSVDWFKSSGVLRFIGGRYDRFDKNQFHFFRLGGLMTRKNSNLILEGLSESRVDEDEKLLEGVKADVRNKVEALMVIELLMKDFKISIKEVQSLFESAEHVQESSNEVLGNNFKISLEQNKRSMSVDNISLHKGWGEKEIKNSIEKCTRTPESVASTLNSSDWIEGKDWQKAAGSNDKKIRLKATDTFGNPMFLTIQF